MTRLKSASLLMASLLMALSGAVLIMADAEEACAQTWQPLPLITPEARQAGRLGGEGGQWPQAIAVDSSGTFLLFGSDVGGIFRSLDGGRTWEPCNVGYSPRGNSGFAIDPHNSRRCLAVGANSVVVPYNGLYLSTDQAASWKPVLQREIAGYRDLRDQLAYDPSTYDEKLGYTTVVYWSRIRDDKPHWGKPEIHPALYKSANGGQTWQEIPNTEKIGGSHIAVHPQAEVVYAANERGFFRSTDGGSTWAQTLTSALESVSVSPSRPDEVWTSSEDVVWRSTDRGATWSRIAGSAVLAASDATLRAVKVSPANADHMVLWREAPNWNWKRFRSTDGGRTWQEAQFDNTGAFLPYNARQALFAWHPRDDNIAWSTGGDWPTKSTDAGATWKYSGDGYNVVLVGGKWNFNAFNPDIMFFGSQDYNGALTTDGGRTWQYANISGHGWGGFCYGGYAATSQVMYAGNADGWGGKRRLRVSRDGGRTFQDTGLSFSGPDVSYGDPTDANILFASDLRSTDGGLTWKPMTGCEAVYTSNAAGARELYGQRKEDIVKSLDKGATWSKVATVAGGISDLAFDHVRNRLYVVSQDRLKMVEGAAVRTLQTPPDQYGSHRIRTVAVDPQDPAIVYAGSSKDIYKADNSVMRSDDAGQSWKVLTVVQPLEGNKDGGREAICIRVHPRTREAWVATSCYGLWKIGPPGTGQQTLPATVPPMPQPETAPPKIVPSNTAQATDPARIPRPTTPGPFRNVSMDEGDAMPTGWELGWVAYGKLHAARDTSEWKKEPASLTIKSVDGPAEGQASQIFAVTDEPITVSGFIKSAVNGNALVMIQAFDKNWKTLGFKQVVYSRNDRKWRAFSREVRLPKGTTHALFNFYLRGTGQAWLDEVTVTTSD